MDTTTKEFIRLLKTQASFESDRNHLQPYLDILENMSYVLPYTKKELIDVYNNER